MRLFSNFTKAQRAFLKSIRDNEDGPTRHPKPGTLSLWLRNEKFKEVYEMLLQDLQREIDLKMLLFQRNTARALCAPSSPQDPPPQQPSSPPPSAPTPPANHPPTLNVERSTLNVECSPSSPSTPPNTPANHPPTFNVERSTLNVECSPSSPSTPQDTPATDPPTFNVERSMLNVQCSPSSPTPPIPSPGTPGEGKGGGTSNQQLATNNSPHTHNQAHKDYRLCLAHQRLRQKTTRPSPPRLTQEQLNDLRNDQIEAATSVAAIPTSPMTSPGPSSKNSGPSARKPAGSSKKKKP